jgi:3-methyl-2-oxobutanoate hydroxymethyltransferase
LSEKPKKRTKITVPKFVKAKADGRKIAMLTGYDFPMAKMLDDAGVDSVLVGDSLGMVVQGKSTTLPVTLDEMIYHGEMVCRAVRYALTIVDMPFGAYHVSPQQAVTNATRVIKETGADAVKIEGGVDMVETIAALKRASIPVFGHIGMQPQSINTYGGFRVQREEQQLLADAHAIEEAGVFGIVLELIPRSLAEKVTAAVSVPTIGIGAGPNCDGQVLVTPDMLGQFQGFQPKFVKRFAELHEAATKAVKDYISEVQDGTYPDENHSHE